ncbi:MULTISPECIES: malonyl-CoA decarboxylase [Pseudomonas]|uniref:malonyl-CoA decarboxylase n=1 Tax=Pseudomonas TaxID=286 RepID=UPI0007EE3BC7|nr:MULTISPECIES: malonyl-CoA decarboxylase [Pseudomonas]MCE4068172.1 malonyl-CoA decarboxylase [Pseudomonas nitritireducens]MCE4077361.1 malonyl-CoA decarboxylase [Pseudomonas nitroreducens]MDG9852604.1 malonyl-CoA decarboxylase [Pseudomonas nitroreducens]NMZ59722.1 malonyl-CoA decarboxylase [Pseudomonas nitroreducens]NMZ75890.1 malonyl-CoA decarboxylase [Pseudomonas nitroreducens]
MNISFFQELLQSISERGRQLLESREPAPGNAQALAQACRKLISGHGEASGVALARQVLCAYRDCPEEQQKAFFDTLLMDFAPPHDALAEACQRYLDDPSSANTTQLFEASEPPRQELFRRLNQAPGGTAELIAMRRRLLGELKGKPELAAVDHDLQHLLASWFNRGFLVLRRIDWSTPASILEKIIKYEAVHAIKDWDDLRSRLQPADRRCFAFFHPALAEEPLIFVEVALTRAMPGAIADILEPATDVQPAEEPDTAVFYSISNCQDGLRGISFGNFLIKQVVEELAREIPGLRQYVTLSPVPGFRRWLDGLGDDPQLGAAAADLLKALKPDAPPPPRTEQPLLALAAEYFLHAKNGAGLPLDPVARFHLGNGARLERLNWRGDLSASGLRQAAGLMVNYRYELRQIEKNHEAYANQGAVAASPEVRKLATLSAKTKR